MNKLLWRYYVQLLSALLAGLVLLSVPLIGNFANIVNDSVASGQTPRSEIVIVAIDDRSLQKIGAWPWNRAVFSQFISELDKIKPAVTSFDVLFLEQRAGDLDFRSAIDKASFPIVLGSKLIDAEVLMPIFSTQTGFVNFPNSPDGKIRSAQLQHEQGAQCLPSLALATAMTYFRATPDTSCDRTIELRKYSIGLTGELSTRFQYSDQRFNQVSFVDVLEGKVAPEILKDKILLVGSTAIDLRSGLNDNFVDVLGRTIPGVEVHANIVNNALQESFLIRPQTAVVLLALIVIILIVIIIHSWFRRLTSELASLLVLLIANIIIGVVILQLNYLWPVFELALLTILLTAANTLDRYLLKVGEGKQMAQFFGRYVNPRLLAQLLQDPGKLQLGGESREMTVLFSDIRGFTSISEGLTSQELVKLINDYLDAMSRQILSRDGTIDKYIGDAIMAFWNAPLDDADHATHAVETALDMQTELRRFQLANPDYPEIKIGIGINTGEMTVGNVGGRDRFDYTVLGDNVNLGSRLEGLTKYYGITTLISGSTYHSYKGDNCIFRLIDIVRVKGKDTPVEIYEPLEIDQQLLADNYQTALKLYQAGDFIGASEQFTKLNSDDPSQTMLKRIQDLKTAPAGWDGVWNFTDK